MHGYSRFASRAGVIGVSDTPYQWLPSHSLLGASDSQSFTPRSQWLPTHWLLGASNSPLEEMTPLKSLVPRSEWLGSHWLLGVNDFCKCIDVLACNNICLIFDTQQVYKKKSSETNFYYNVNIVEFQPALVDCCFENYSSFWVWEAVYSLAKDLMYQIGSKPVRFHLIPFLGLSLAVFK